MKFLYVLHQSQEVYNGSVSHVLSIHTTENEAIVENVKNRHGYYEISAIDYPEKKLNRIQKLATKIFRL